jgi:hypothetical protein
MGRCSNAGVMSLSILHEPVLGRDYEAEQVIVGIYRYAHKFLVVPMYCSFSSKYDVGLQLQS